jgi:hypothetical protein
VDIGRDNAVLVCDEHGEIWLHPSLVDSVRPWFAHSSDEIAYGLLQDWAVVGSNSKPEFRIWLPSGMPLEDVRADIVDLLDCQSLIDAPPDDADAPYTDSWELSNAALAEQLLVRRPTLLTRARYSPSQIEFALATDSDRESVIRGRSLDVEPTDLLDRVVAVMNRTGGLYAMVAGGLFIEHRISGLYSERERRLHDKAFPFGVGWAGLPGIGWRSVFGPALVEAIGTDAFDELHEQGWAEPAGDCWIVHGAEHLDDLDLEDLGDDGDPNESVAAAGDLERLVVDVLGADRFFLPGDDTLPTQVLGDAARSRHTVIQSPFTETLRRDVRTYLAYELHHPDGSTEDAYDHPELAPIKASTEAEKEANRKAEEYRQANQGTA